MSAAAVALFVRPRSVAAPVVSSPPTPTRSGATPVPAPVRPAAPAPSPSLGEARAAASRGELTDAARLFRDALRERPEDPEAWNDLGVVRVRQGDLVGGTDAFRQALQREPGHSEALRNLGVVLDRRGRRQEAEAQYRRFLEIARAGHPAIDDVRRRLHELETSPPSGDRP